MRDYIHRVVIERREETQDSDYGDPSWSWSEYATRWMSRRPLSGRERFNAAATESEVDTEFRCHYTPGITPKMRLRVDTPEYVNSGLETTTTYDVEAVWDDGGRLRETVIQAKASNAES